MKNYIKLFRVLQWIKNLFVFVPILFSRNLFIGADLIIVIGAFFLFCLVSSAVYIINDIADIEADRAHPLKKERPLASGKISQKTAVYIAVFLLITAALLTPFFNLNFILCLGIFFIINILYTFSFKHVVLLDIFSIATGFMIRVIAGAVVINVELSSWLILTTMFISLFLAVLKRHSELFLNEGTQSTASRKVLADYSLDFARQMATVAASGVIICYALYTVSQRTIIIFGTENLIYTTPFVVFGIFRYMFLVYMNHKGENTTNIMVSDMPMIVTVLLYIFSTVAIIYHII